MRRILALTLLIAFSSPLILPLLATPAHASSSLPACCRRDGSHHCNLGMGDSSAAPAFKAAPCPMYPLRSATLRQVAASISSPLAWIAQAARDAAPARLGSHDPQVALSLGENISASLTSTNVANRRVLLDNSLTFGGFHHNDPREIFAELRYRFKY